MRSEIFRMVALLSRQFCLREERGRGEQAFSQPVVLSQAIHIPLSTCYVQFQSDWLTLKQIITITLTRSTVRVLQAAYVPHAMQVAETKTKCQLMWPEIHIFRRSVRDLHMIVSKEPNNQHWLEVVSWARFGVGHDFQTSLQPLVVPKTRDEMNSKFESRERKACLGYNPLPPLLGGHAQPRDEGGYISAYFVCVSVLGIALGRSP